MNPARQPNTESSLSLETHPLIAIALDTLRKEIDDHRDGDLELPFPSRLDLKLSEPQRAALQHLSKMVPHKNNKHLLAVVLSHGVFAMLSDNMNPKATELIEPLRASTRSREIEAYVATPVSDDLRNRLQDFLTHHPELDEEAAWVRLLELGLQNARKNPRS